MQRLDWVVRSTKLWIGEEGEAYKLRGDWLL